jgi:hypothetical protein
MQMYYYTLQNFIWIIAKKIKKHIGAMNMYNIFVLKKWITTVDFDLLLMD